MTKKTQALEAIWALRDLLSNPEAWSKEYNSGADGSVAHPDSATRLTLVGAIIRVCPPLLVVVAIEQVAGMDILSIQNKSTHAELRSYLERATEWLARWE